MARMFKGFRGLFLFVMLLSVSARVFTGASEAQVNFTSLVVDQNIAAHQAHDSVGLLHGAILTNTGNASSIPDKHRTYATYKKYVTPDKSFSVDVTDDFRHKSFFASIDYISSEHLHSSIFLPLANSPPIRVSARSFTHTSTADLSVGSENNFGEFTLTHHWRVNRI